MIHTFHVRPPDQVDWDTFYARTISEAVQEFFVDNQPSCDFEANVTIEARKEGEKMFQVFDVYATISVDNTGKRVVEDPDEEQTNQESS